MRINEITSSKPPTPEQSRIAALQATKDRASNSLQAERKRQKVAKARSAMSAAIQIKPIAAV